MTGLWQFKYCKYASFEWDEDKRRKTKLERGVDFLFFQPVLGGSSIFCSVDERKNYGEVRIRAMAFVKGRLMSFVYTEREPSVARIISARKANKRGPEGA